MKRLLFNLLFWSLLFMFILAVRYFEIGKIAFINLPVEIPTYRIVVNGLILGIAVGFFYTLVEVRLESLHLYDNSLGRIILLRTAYLFVVCGITLAVLAYLNYTFDVETNAVDTASVNPLTYIFSATVRFLFAGALIGNFILSLFHTLRSKIGHSDFNNLLIGKYRKPVEEDRAFMFLDLKSSTTIAEKLGHRLYSRLIQDCFRDLTQTLVRTKAEVYQYVGDEAVLSWPIDTAIENANCVRAYFNFVDLLMSRRAHYESTYGLLPIFKAGVNMGAVTVVEVGVWKRAIVYHSDVLNTAARVQSLCNQYQKTLLVTEDVANGLTKSDFNFEFIGNILLKGKTIEVGVFAVAREEQP